jgi:23S rRNA pseudouridine1911/1915/1917 synthase
MEPTSFLAEPGRLDVAVAKRLGIPRAEVQRHIEEGRILVEGQARPKSFHLSGGERIEVSLRQPGDLQPDPQPIAVLYQDDHLMVVSKPAGVVTHPSPSHRTGTLVNRLLALGVPLSRGGGADRLGIVHRLDVGTSGAMIVAKDDSTHWSLADMFRRHLVERHYLALARGRVEQDHFLLEAPLGRRGARIRVSASMGRRSATEFVVRDRLPRATLLEAMPKTGRTHQIRVHLAALGHPVLGDRSYGGAGPDAQRLGLDRPFLHSWRIAFDHPVTGNRIEIEDPLPEDLESALSLARQE